MALGTVGGAAVGQGTAAAGMGGGFDLERILRILAQIISSGGGGGGGLGGDSKGDNTAAPGVQMKGIDRWLDPSAISRNITPSYGPTGVPFLGGSLVDPEPAARVAATLALIRNFGGF